MNIELEDHAELSVAWRWRRNRPPPGGYLSGSRTVFG